MVCPKSSSLNGCHSLILPVHDLLYTLLPHLPHTIKDPLCSHLGKGHVQRAINVKFFDIKTIVH